MNVLPALVPVDDATRVAEVRRIAVASAEAEGLDKHSSGQVAIIATEIASNLLKHARSGEVHISRLSAAGEPGLEISDPFGASSEAYEECWRRIRRHVQRIVPQVREALRARSA